MKKGIIVFLISAGILAAAAAFYFYQTKLAKFTVEKILPEGAVGYLHVLDIEKRWEDFRTTRLWQNIKAIDVPLLMEKSHFTPQQIDQYHKIREWLSDPVLYSLFMKFFGQEVALGFYPVNPGPSQPSQPQDLVSGLIVVTRLKQEAEILELVSHLLRPLAVHVQTKTQDYKNHKITTIPLANGMPILAYTKIRNFLILSLGEKGVRGCIDVFTKAKRSLAEDPLFGEARSQFLDSAQTLGYANVEFLFSHVLKNMMALSLPEGSAQTQEKFSEQMDEAFQQMAGFKAWVYSSSGLPAGKAGDGSLIKGKFAILYDKERLDPRLKTMYSCPPVENKTLGFIPHQVIGYQWNNCTDLKSQWEYLKEGLQEEAAQSSREKRQAPSSAETIATIESAWKLSIEKDILPALGDEWGGYWSGLDLTGVFPLPKLLFFIKINDLSAAEKVMTTLTQNQYLLLQNESYKNVAIQYVVLPLGVDWQPGYCFLNGYLLLATSLKELKDAIDTANDSSLSLAVDEGFKKVDRGLTDKNNSVLFLRLDEVLRQGRAIVDWALDQMKAKAARDQAFKQGIEERLATLKQDLAKQELELKGLKSYFQRANEQLPTALQTEGQDTTKIWEEINSLQNQIKEHEKGIAVLKGDQSRLEETLASFKEDKTDPELVQLYVDKVLFPILEGLEPYKALGSRVVFGDKALDSTSFIKVEK